MCYEFEKTKQCGKTACIYNIIIKKRTGAVGRFGHSILFSSTELQSHGPQLKWHPSMYKFCLDLGIPDGKDGTGPTAQKDAILMLLVFRVRTPIAAIWGITWIRCIASSSASWKMIVMLSKSSPILGGAFIAKTDL